MKKNFDKEKISKDIDSIGARPEMLVQILQAIVSEYSYISEDIIRLVSQKLNLSRAEVHGVVNFYHDFRTKPAGKTVIKICQAEACQAMGSRNLTAQIEKILGVKMHETTADKKYTLEPIYCLGNCACSPAIMINNRVHGRVNKTHFNTLINGEERK